MDRKKSFPWIKKECIISDLQIDFVKKKPDSSTHRCFQKYLHKFQNNFPHKHQVSLLGTNTVIDPGILIQVVGKRQWKDYELYQNGSLKLNVKRKDTCHLTVHQSMTTNLLYTKMNRDMIDSTTRHLHMFVNLLEWLVTLFHIPGYVQTNHTMNLICNWEIIYRIITPQTISTSKPSKTLNYAIRDAEFT